jgi:hypothetical protein
VSLLPYFRVQPYLWPYPLLSWCLKWAPSPPLPPMISWLPVCFPLAPAVCAGTRFSDDLVRCSCDKLSAAPRMILVLCILPPPHAKGYVWLMTCLPHVLHCKPDSDRHLTMFPAECPVFHHMHPSPFSRSCLPLQGVVWPSSLVAFSIRLPRFALWRFPRFRIENPLARGSLSILPTSSVAP